MSIAFSMVMVLSFLHKAMLFSEDTVGMDLSAYNKIYLLIAEIYNGLPLPYTRLRTGKHQLLLPLSEPIETKPLQHLICFSLLSPPYPFIRIPLLVGKFFPSIALSSRD